MIVYRAMQGFCGGAITPTVWPVVYTKFRGQELATVIAIISVIPSLSSRYEPVTPLPPHSCQARGGSPRETVITPSNRTVHGQVLLFHRKPFQG